jgi:hypothetical protein
MLDKLQREREREREKERERKRERERERESVGRLITRLVSLNAHIQSIKGCHLQEMFFCGSRY